MNGLTRRRFLAAAAAVTAAGAVRQLTNPSTAQAAPMLAPERRNVARAALEALRAGR